MKFANQLKLWLALMLAVGLAGTGCTAKVKKAYHERKADKFFAADDLDRAEIEYMNVFRTDQENLKAITRLGGIYYDQGRLQRAAYFLGKASQMASNDLDLRVKLGFVNQGFGMFKAAHEAAEFVLARRPSDSQAPLLLEESAVRAAEIDIVRRELLALAKSNDSAAIQVALGNLSLREKDFPKATEFLQRAQKMDAKSSLVNTAFGALYWQQNDLKQAETYFKAAAEAAPMPSSFRLQYARFKIRQGQTDEAKKMLDEMLAKMPGFVPAMMAQAEIAAAAKKFDECDAWLTKVLGRDDYNFEAMLYQGQARQLRGDVAGALQAFERATRLFPQSALAYYYLAQANLAAQDRTAALQNLSRALELQSEFTEATVLQSQLLLQSGNAAPVVVTPPTPAPSSGGGGNRNWRASKVHPPLASLFGRCAARSVDSNPSCSAVCRTLSSLH